ncbi:MAG: hypothetical protein JWP97_4266 [Labilithrix sp.]|nr:hypothetical protein [Labilithrix sp.]
MCDGDLPAPGPLRNALSLMMRAVFLGSALLLMGCNEPAPGERVDVQVSRTPQATAETVRPAVSWPEPAAVDDRALSAIVRASARPEAELRGLVARSPVPVLAPRDLVLERPTVVVEGEYFALTGRAAGATIALQGTRAARRYEGVAPVAGNRDVRGSKGFVSANEGIRTASWNENGAAYSLDVECADPAGDARCQSDDFVLSVAAQLVYVGGAGR